jgi:hypothetical protein
LLKHTPIELQQAQLTVYIEFRLGKIDTVHDTRK